MRQNEVAILNQEFTTQCKEILTPLPPLKPKKLKTTPQHFKYSLYFRIEITWYYTVLKRNTNKTFPFLLLYLSTKPFCRIALSER